jgi:parvulin-like peptidyl-prolyl isomerase
MKITVNREVIPPEAVEREVQNYRRQNPGTDENEAAQEVSQKMIEWALIRQHAAKKALPVSPEEVEAGLQQLFQGHGGKEQFFQRFGLTEDRLDEVRRDVERNRQITKFLDGLANGIEDPTEEALTAHYTANADRFVHPEKVHAAHIVKHPQNEAAEQAAAAELTAIRQRLLAGEDFLTVAGEVSECNDTAPDLGEFARGQMVPEFELIVFSMNPGEVSPVFKTQFGLHIATVLDRTGTRPMLFEECREQIAAVLLHDLKNEAIGAWVDAEKKRAEILIAAD